MDWFSFLRQNNIPFTTTGPNASRGRVNVKCPFCGQDDPSEHMGISLRGRGWSCWRNSSHRGRSTPRIIAALLRISLAEAEQLAGGEVSLPTDVDLGQSIRARLGGQLDVKIPRRTLDFNREFKSLDSASRFADQFYDYIYDRGYQPEQATWLVRAYDLHYATTGKFAYRIIIPVEDRWGDLLTWTGRTIITNEELRYKSLKNEEQICSPKEALLGLPLLHQANNARALVICEGPFDAFWITLFGHRMGVYGTCLFGLSMSPQQMELLIGLRTRFPFQTILLDSSASFQAFKLASSGVGIGVTRLEDATKDPASLSPNEATELCLRLLDRSYGQ